MPIKKRLWVLAFAGGISGLFLVPYLLVSRPDINPTDIWLGLPLGSLLVSALCAWAGLKFADRANISMPYLRPWETGKRADSTERGWLIRVSIAAGGGIRPYRSRLLLPRRGSPPSGNSHPAPFHVSIRGARAGNRGPPVCYERAGDGDETHVDSHSIERGGLRSGIPCGSRARGSGAHLHLGFRLPVRRADWMDL